jgi:hypothetical protein
VPRIDRYREFLPDLKAHLKVFGDLVEVVAELGCGRWTVKRRIVSHCPEQRLSLILVLAIFPEAFPRKGALGILPLVDLALPAFIGPGGSAKADQWRE